MAQADITKSVQTLQNMINIVVISHDHFTLKYTDSILKLVKTGNSIRSYRKESSTSQINAYTGNSFILPNAVENFHMALDDLETEIVSDINMAKGLMRKKQQNLKKKKVNAVIAPL